MITDERDLAGALRTAYSPPGLTLDPEEVLGRVRRADRRRRTGRAALATGSVAAVTVAALWAAGTAPGPLAVLPAAPWTESCRGIVEDPSGTSIDLDQVSYAEVPLPGAPSTTAVVAFDQCRDGGAKVAYATRDADGRLGDAQSWSMPDAESVRTLRDGLALVPQVVASGDGELLYGVVGTDATDLQVLTNSGSDAVERVPIPGTGLDAYVSPEFDDPELDTLGMAWRGDGGLHVTWLQVLDAVSTGGAAPAPEALIAQGRDGIWRIWQGFAQHTVHAQPLATGGGVLFGAWSLAQGSDDGGLGRELLAYLPAGADIEVSTAEGGDAGGAEIHYGEPEHEDWRIAWVTAPSGSVITWVAPDGERRVLEEQPGPTRTPSR